MLTPSQSALDLAARIRQAREAIGLSQRELADAIRTCAVPLKEPLLADVNKRVVSYWEAGKVRLFTYHAAAIARVTGVSADWLLGLSEHIGGDE